jgi:hypothetical protein
MQTENWATESWFRSPGRAGRFVIGTEFVVVDCYAYKRTTALGKTGDIFMRLLTTLTVAAGVLALTACNNNSPREEAADNVEANAENVADNLEEAADNASTDTGEDALENKADATRAAGENAAEDLRTNEADTNTANGM